MLSEAGRLGSRACLLGAALLAGACYDFHLEGPEDPSPIVVPRLVSVTIEYRQPNGCVNESLPCDEGPVVFFGSWMRQGGEFALTPIPGTHIWRGTAIGVPVNFPPKDDPYFVRVFDPHLLESPTDGITAERLQVGRELLRRFDSPGGPKESGLVYIDENGFGHNPS